MKMIEQVARAMFAQDHDEAWKAGEDATKAIYLNNARAAVQAIEAAGYAIVPNEPSPEMLAAALPITGVHCDPATIRLAESAIMLLETRPVQSRVHADGLAAAQALIGDYRAMLAAAPEIE